MKHPDARRDSRSSVGRFVDRLYRQWCPELKLAAYITALATDTTEHPSVVDERHYYPGQMGSFFDTSDTRAIEMPSGKTVILSSTQKGNRTTASATFPVEPQWGPGSGEPTHMTLHIHDTRRLLGHDIQIGYDYRRGDGTRFADTITTRPFDDMPLGLREKLGQLAVVLDQMPSAGMPTYEQAVAA